MRASSRIRIHSREHIAIYTVGAEPLFFQHFDGPFYPTLRFLHKCASRGPASPCLYMSLTPFIHRATHVTADPYILPQVQVDRGAIRFLLAGAHMMCPGLTSPGGRLPPAEAAIPAERMVAIHAEGKEHAVGVGLTKFSTEEMKAVNKGVGVETACYLGDDLWALKTL